MKKQYFLVLLTAAILFTSANLPDIVKSTKSFVGLLDPLEPVLPETPYNYDIAFPEHIIFGSWDFTDSSVINSLISPDGATLGRVLFYDKKLSSSNDVACASCHKQAFAFADNVQFSEGINGTLTTRNSPNLNDLAWQTDFNTGEPFPPLFWDCREPDLAQMVLQPILHQGELGKDMPVLIEKLNNTTYYPELFQQAFGTSQITPERIGIALAEFIRSMSVFDSKFDKVQTGLSTYTSQEAAGAMVFESSCGQICHISSSFTPIFPMNNGLDIVCADIGYQAVTGVESDNGKFKSPSLRNISLTAPYMHDGRFETIDEVIEFYSEELQPHPFSDMNWMLTDPTGFHFTASQKAELKAFLQTLTSESLTTDVKWSDPFQEVNSVGILALDEKIVVYPNPFAAETLVELSGSGEFEIRITNLSGHVLRTLRNVKKTATIERGQLSPGVYQLEIRKGDRMSTQRIVIQ
ncbi:MAG: T9SS type A sorting domain-containing protein [Saprospiraceae bacterium]|nr:T9SS type A sorting domain-containing protein [Saprospiraceae bacterium]